MKSELNQRVSRPLATRLLRVVFGFFLVVVICLTIVQMAIEYRYQENSIRKEFSNIQTSFENVLAGQMWHLDENALRSTVKGIAVRLRRSLQDEWGGGQLGATKPSKPQPHNGTPCCRE